MEITTYKDALNFLYSLQKYGIKFGLSKTENLLKDMGNPEKRLKFIHVAGTNGKGSVATYITSILKSAGYKTGLYTSPHLVTFRERMKINGEFISEQDVIYYTNMVKEIMNEQEPPTFFEAVTAMAIKYFCDKEADVVVLETGMGGRLDATNVVKPILTIITNISMEHQEFLGNTLIQIAKEKAGIIKDNIPLISGVNQDEVIDLFKRYAEEKNVPFYLLNKDFSCNENLDGEYLYHGIKNSFEKLKSGLKGKYQRDNLAISLAASEILMDIGFEISKKDIFKGVEEAFWPGRMHLISNSPKILLDGAHNIAAMDNLILSLSQINYKKLILVIGVMADKDVRNILKLIVPKSDFTIYTRPKYYRAMDPAKLKEHIDIEHNCEIIENLDDAIYHAKDIAGREDLILITGSLFTVGEALTILDPENYPKEVV